jgi:hypothetical protein
LADIKVGDFISAEGALHAEIFLATNLRIMDPQTGRAHGQVPGGAAPVQ